jgi:amino acid adenylation domain-containing protein
VSDLITGLTLADCLEAHAQRSPAATALRELGADLQIVDSASWEELERTARGFAWDLRSRGVQVGDRVVVACQGPLNYVRAVLGCFVAGAIVVPLPHARGARLRRWVEAVAPVCRPKFGVLEPSRADLDAGPVPLTWLPPPELPAAEPPAYPEKRSVDDIALIQFTSGSLSEPKGVVLRHGALMANELAIGRAFDHGQETRVLGWLPLNHDMGLIGNVLQTVYLGAECILMKPSAFSREPLNWLRAISRYRARTSGGPNSAYAWCVERAHVLTPGELDLSCWRLAFNGAEMVRAQTLKSFGEAFAAFGFDSRALFPCYGLAEASLFVAGGKVGDVSKSPVSCGKSAFNAQVLIVDPERHTVVRDGREGEIWVQGPNVADAYWEQPEETQRKLKARLANGTERGTFLRTGDIGLLRNGEIVPVGRLKEVLTFFGRNYVAPDLEATAASAVSGLGPGQVAALAIERGDREELVFLAERPKSVPENEAARLMTAAISEQHEVFVADVVFVGAGGLPRTTSGKLRRHACHERYLAEAARPRPQESGKSHLGLSPEVANAVAGCLGRSLDTIEFGLSFRALGGDSISAARLSHRLERHCRLSIALEDLLSDGAMLPVLLAGAKVEARPPVPSAWSTDVPMTSTQETLWMQSQLDDCAGSAHVAWCARLSGKLDPGRLQIEMEAIADRHRALRAAVLGVGERPCLRTLTESKLELELVDATAWTGHELEREVQCRRARPFVAEAPLYRFTLFREAERRHLALVVAHHVVADLRSLLVLVSELFPKIGSASVPSRSDYGAFAAAESHYLASPRFLGDLQAWKDGYVRIPLELTHDRPTPKRPSFHGAALRKRVAAEAAEPFLARATACGVASSEALLAAYALLLMRVTNQVRATIMCPVDVRAAAGAEGVVGCGINMIPVQFALDERLSVDEFLVASARSMRQALGRQRLPVKLLGAGAANEFGGPGAFSQASFSWLDRASAQGTGLLESSWHAGFGGERLEISVVPLPVDSVQHELEVRVAQPSDGSLELVWAYQAALFEPATVRRIADRFEALLDALGQGDAGEAARAPIWLAGEAAQIEAYSRGAERAYPPVTLWQLFESCVQAHPADVAVTQLEPCTILGAAVGTDVSYAELAALAQGVAHLLGDGELDSIVGVLMPRSLAMVAVMLGVSAAGGAFAPMNPHDPPTRIATMCRDAGCRFLITECPLEAALLEQLPSWTRVLDLSKVDSPAARLVQQAARLPDALAYVMFTSGSTGQPKGVQIEHRGIVNRLLSMREEIGVRRGDIVLQKTAPTFDVAMWEIFLPLSVGARLALAPAGAERDPERLADLLRHFHVTIVHFIPSMLALFLQTAGRDLSLPSLRQILCSGEELTRHIRDAAIDAFGPCVELWNLYGPTEASIDVTLHRAHRNEHISFIGKPVINTSLEVRDRFGNLAPIGVTGELVILGPQVARGYAGQPALSARAFEWAAALGWRSYRSGDHARWHDGGLLEFRGRIDRQVKLFGRRVELTEIEAALCACSDVTAAAVEVIDGSLLYAHIVPATAARPVSVSALRSSLRQRLPPALIPSAFGFLPMLPQTATGKLDRQRLAALRTNVEAEAQAEADTPIERRLSEIWAQVLGCGTPGLDDSFFDLGGDSIRALRAVALAAQAGLKLTVADIYAAPSVRAAAANLRFEGATEVAGAGATLALGEDGSAFPLSSAQLSLVYLSQQDPRYEVYVTSLELFGPFDGVALQGAVQRLVDRHGFLRVAYDLAATPVPTQRVEPRAEIRVAFHDLRSWPAVERAAEVVRFFAEERQRPFDWEHAPMLRVAVHRLSDESFRLTFSDPTLDGWCVATALAEILECYWATLRDGRMPELVPAPDVYREFVELEQLAANDPQTRAFWQARLGDLSSLEARRTELSAEVSRTTLRHEIALGTELSSRLQSAARLLGTTPKSLLLSAHLYALSVARGSQRVTTGIEVNGRPEVVGGDSALGMFNNVLPVSMSLAHETWAELVVAAQRAEGELLPYRRMPHAQLRDMAGGDLCDSVFVYTDFHVYERVLQQPTPQVVDFYASDQTYFGLCVHFSVDRISGGLRLMLDFDACQYDMACVRGFAAAIQRGLWQIVYRPFDFIDRNPEWETLPGVRRPLLEEPRPAPLSELATQSTRGAPDAVAVESTEGQLSYAALERRSDVVARRLNELGVGPESVVALAVSGGLSFVSCLLGVLKAGAAFLPMDKERAAARRDETLRAARCVAVIHDGGVADAPCTMLDARDLQKEQPGAPFRAPRLAAEQLAYVIYTSGSSGVPKGVAVSHGSLANYLTWAAHAYAFDDGRGATVVTSTEVDLTLTGLLCPLAVGRRVTFAAVDGDAEVLASCVNDPDLGVLKISPSHLALVAASGIELRTNRWPAEIVVGGEQLLKRHLDIVGADVSVINEYGPAEATIGCSIERTRSAASTAAIVPIGRAMAGAELHLLDVWERPTPAGLPGEVVVSGPGVARGYLHDPVRTAERFRPLSRAGAGQRGYFTGDVAVENGTGSFTFLGRRDLQVKIRGFRVEPGEVEAHMHELPSLRQALVTAIAGPDGRQVLAACCVAEPGSQPEPASIRAALARRLPQHLVPARIVVVDEMPIAPGGKVDRERVRQILETDSMKERTPLTAPSGECAEPAAKAPPQNALEADLCAIMGVAFGVPVGPLDDFFQLGGDSIMTVGLAAQARRRGIGLSSAQIFATPTVRGMARALSVSPGAGLIEGSVTEPPLGSATLPLSAMQNGVLYHALASAAPDAYISQFVCRYPAELDVGRLIAAFRSVAERRTALRCAIAYESDGTAVLSVAARCNLPVQIHDWSDWSSDESVRAVETLAVAERLRGFDLERAPLMRLAFMNCGVEGWRCIWTHHHLILDGWSQLILLKEVFDRYSSTEQMLASDSAASAAYAAAAAAPLAPARAAVWRARLAAARALPLIDGKRVSGRPQTVTLGLDAGTTAALRKRMSESGATLAAAVQAAWAIVLSGACGRDSVVFGVTVAARPEAISGSERLVGLCINTLPCAVEVSPSREILDIVREMVTAQVERFQGLLDPLSEILKQSPHAKFGALLVIENFDRTGHTDLGPPGLRPIETAFYSREDYPVVCVASDNDQRLTLEIKLDPNAELSCSAAVIADRMREVLTLLSEPGRARVDEALRISQRRAAVSKTKEDWSRLADYVSSRRPSDGLGAARCSEDGFPLLVEAAQPGVDLVAWAIEHRSWIAEQRRTVGAILFRGFEFDGADDLTRFVEAMARRVMQYSERTSPRTLVKGCTYTSTEHPADQCILLHNENSYASSWPQQIVFHCVMPPARGGQTTICDCRRVLSTIDPEVVREFQQRGIVHVRNFTPGIGLSIEQVFGTADRASVESSLERSGYELEWLGAGRLRTRKRMDAVLRHPETQVPIWFNHAAFFNAAALPEAVRASMLELFGAQGLPNNTFFADCTPIPEPTIAHILSAYERNRIQFDWRTGDCMLLDNMLVAHGREPFDGGRRVLVAMADPVRREEASVVCG